MPLACHNTLHFPLLSRLMAYDYLLVVHHYSRMLKSPAYEILMFVCLQDDTKQCCDPTKLDYTHYVGFRILSSFVASQYHKLMRLRYTPNLSIRLLVYSEPSICQPFPAIPVLIVCIGTGVILYCIV